MRPRAALIVVLLGVAAAVICWFALRQPEPQYKGRSLSYWVTTYGKGEDQIQGAEAIRTFGTNAFPLLLEWIRRPEPQRHPLLVRIARMLPGVLRPAWANPGHSSLRAARSAYCFRALGNQASPMIPDLSRLGADPTNDVGAAMAMFALAHIGSNSVPALLAAIRDPSHPHRDAAAQVLPDCVDLGPYTNSVVSELLRQLDDPVVPSATVALGRIAARPDVVVPVLAQRLERTNLSSQSRVPASIALNFFGAEAAPALPYLTNALNDPDPEVRGVVAAAIEEIHRQIQQR